jgi:hypothetical protein
MKNEIKDIEKILFSKYKEEDIFDYIQNNLNDIEKFYITKDLKILTNYNQQLRYLSMNYGSSKLKNIIKNIDINKKIIFTPLFLNKYNNLTINKYHFQNIIKDKYKTFFFFDTIENYIYNISQYIKPILSISDIHIDYKELLEIFNEKIINLKNENNNKINKLKDEISIKQRKKIEFELLLEKNSINEIIKNDIVSLKEELTSSNKSILNFIEQIEFDSNEMQNKIEKLILLINKTLEKKDDYILYIDNLEEKRKKLLNYIKMILENQKFYEKELEKYNNNKLLSLNILLNCIDNDLIYPTIKN